MTLPHVSLICRLKYTVYIGLHMYAYVGICICVDSVINILNTNRNVFSSKYIFSIFIYFCIVY
jgi:hypothetical protein